MPSTYAYCLCGRVTPPPSNASLTIARSSFLCPLKHPLRRPRPSPFSRPNNRLVSCILGGNVPSSANNDNGDSSDKNSEGESGGYEDGDEEDTSKEVLQVFRPGVSDVPDVINTTNSSSDATAPTSATSSGIRVELPLFPLQVVLNPGCVIPLYIFELRYRLLFNRIHDGQEAYFGVVMFDKESESLAKIGCSAELARFEPLPDGRIMTRNIGRQRFRILKILDEQPYMRALVEYITDDAPDPECAALEKQVWTVLQDVLSLSNKLYDKQFDMTSEIQKSAPKVAQNGNNNNEVLDPVRMQEFSFAVNQILDMPLRDQQLLLQMKDTGKRLRRQYRMLKTARNYLAAQVTIKNAGLKGW